GTAAVGATLNATAGIWTKPPTAIAYSWLRCNTVGRACVAIAAAAASSYVPATADAGHTLVARLQGTVGTGSQVVLSVPTAGLTVEVGGSPVYVPRRPRSPASALASTAQPALSGKAVQGQALTATPGAWTPSAASVSYAWQRCNANGRICTAIAGAAAATYVPVAADVGHALAALVTATVSGKTQAALSVASDAVAAPPVLAVTAPPAVTGTLKVGQQLNGTSGVWTGTAPITYVFQWHRCDTTGAHCSSVHGATKQTYRLSKADAGETLGLTVTATDATAKTPAYASLVGPVAASAATLASTAQPSAAVQGQTLTVDAGAWTVTPASRTYQWQRCNA